MTKALTLRSDTTEYERLRTLAFMEDRPMSDVTREAIHEHLKRKAAQEAFRASLEQAMQDNAQVLADLAKR
jgi:predicted transcriptional regulator